MSFYIILTTSIQDQRVTADLALMFEYALHFLGFVPQRYFSIGKQSWDGVCRQKQTIL